LTISSGCERSQRLAACRAQTLGVSLAR
jgi:hypothetical protein